MGHATHPPETDLIVPLPDGEHWDPHTIHTHYFSFSIPHAQIGAFLYLRYQPAFPLCQGGAAIFRGTDNINVLDIDHLNYEITMPWPDIDANTITTANGLRIEFMEPGREVRISYASTDGQTKLDLIQTAVTPLLARGHVMPGEENYHNAPGRVPGGSEQFMHCTGQLELRGEHYDIDCYAIRDRSWRQVRKETQGGVPVPPVGWTPMYFGPDLIFNQVGFEAPDTNPEWLGVYEVPDGAPTHHFAWLHSNGENKQITRVRRNVLQRQPHTFASLRQEIEAEDEDGRIYRFVGEAIATATLPAWPNVSFHDSVYRWEDEQGRVTHSTYQETWFDRYHRAVKARSRHTATD
ncbi:hypothetical protein GCM10023322_76090 [Rugosimonospora acidiphila]|uniref:DUF7064 domain-containing protein n=1 Tax=Rugosimonospora acidiphila TaxID=556531 RepID=A0ABP9SS64_9ACTN